MPTYVYKCNECDHVFEARQRFTDQPLTECPQCRDGEVRRIINSVGVVFKGSGFYVTDSRNGKNGSAGSSSNGTPSTVEKKTDTVKSKTEKTETKAEDSKK